MNLKNSARSAALALFAALAAASVFPQSQATTGQITGRAVDSQGGALPAVKVTVSNPATGFSRSVTTNAEGLYSLPLLPPGNYEMSAELNGFQTVRRTQIVVTVGSNVNMDLHLGVAGVAEAVTVEGAGAQVETGTDIRTATLNSAVPGLRDPDPDRAGGHVAGPDLARGTAWDQHQHQRRRGRLQPALLRGDPRGRALQLRIHDPAGVDPGVPGGGLRLHRGVRPLVGRDRQRRHQVGHEPVQRIRFLRGP
ncbi:MAG: hypothetical protein DMF80_21375 [Acidobacteria bacterium]|nr:MAG: hypothetical protein DMF80_21375 [Acidobacteriota bacterium]